jgi:uncharacterized protein YifE (UPF0438 family)
MIKKRLPIEQLREAKIIADEMLKKKGVIARDSIINAIEKDPNAPMLPGIPSYLPHEWTIAAGQLMLYRITKAWMSLNKNNNREIEKIDKFFIYILKRLKEEESKFKKDEKKMSKLIKKVKNVPILSEVFAPTRNKETAYALQKFFADSFAVAIVLKRNDTTSSYIDWFLNEWTVSMIGLWHRNNENEKLQNNIDKSTNK